MNVTEKIINGIRQVMVMGEKIDQLGRNTERLMDVLRDHETRISRLEGASTAKQKRLTHTKRGE